MVRIQFLTYIILMAFSFVARAQVGIGTSTPSSSAQLEVSATGKGLLIPRMTYANRPSSPSTGLLIYQTDSTKGFYYHDGATWNLLTNYATASTAFNDTLIRNLYTNGYKITSDGLNGLVMYNNGSFVDTGKYGTTGLPAVAGSGTRLMWLPGKAAFRAGGVSGSAWDTSNIGNYSAAFGADCKASGSYSLAAGQSCNATANQAVAIGFSSTSSQAGSVTLGLFNTSSGASATAIGRSNTASGFCGFVTGINSLTSGNTAFAAGIRATASGNYSVAMGSNVSTNSKNGSFIFSDTSSTAANNDADNQMMMRFTGGYKLFTNSSATAGIQLTPGSVLKYLSNVSGSYDSRSLTDKSYVDSVANAAVFDDTLIRNLYTNGYLISADGITGIKMYDNGQLVDTGTFGSGSTLSVSGAGTRMIWYPKSAAFRAGGVTGSQWNSGSIGLYSVAFGNDNTASAPGSASFGASSTASGHQSFAAGYQVTASGTNAIALGLYNTSSGTGSASIGYQSTASNTGAVALGQYNQATGLQSFAVGNHTIASGGNSVAMGKYVSTNGMSGSFVFGDTSNTTASNDTSNQMMMRFSGGYKLYSDANSTVGTQLVAGGNSWSIISDKRKKENFKPVNGEQFLSRIAKISLTSWNYKGQDPRFFRHYGPMAQDFFQAFGRDEIGIVGNDTAINQADMEGVSFIAIQALEKRSRELQEENEILKREVKSLKRECTERLEHLERLVRQLPNVDKNKQIK